jgi:hypothetical protein
METTLSTAAGYLPGILHGRRRARAINRPPTRLRVRDGEVQGQLQCSAK